MKHKLKILELRSQGKTYKEIQEELGCSKSNIAYHCNQEVKKSANLRNKKRRNLNPLLQKTERFCIKNKKLYHKALRFHKITELLFLKQDFSWQKIVETYGWQTKCYLTGRDLDLKDGCSYHFDHKIPVSKGGNNLFSNLGIACRDANQAKSDMLLEDFIVLCRDVLVHHGYKVEKQV